MATTGSYRALMGVSPRAQYLTGNSVVNIESSVWPPGPRALEAVRRDGRLADAANDPDADASHGDVRQATYYQRVLQDLRAAAAVEVSHHYASMAGHEADGDTPGVRRCQRIIHVKETELAAIDRLTDALSSRFPTSQVPIPASRHA